MQRKKQFQSALAVMKGIDPPSAVNPEIEKRWKEHKPTVQNAEDYFKQIRAGARVALSQSITLLESTRADHQNIAAEIVNACLPYSGNSIRVGITGVPGVGKSTFIETLGMYLISKGKKVAVLAVDPSSQRSKGSILGDKTRMEQLSSHPDAFIRPSPSGGALGGVARKTRESVFLCEAAGFDVVLIETVGVGQSETMVHSMVDFFVLLMLAGAGDELQGIKRGIMEMADAVIIHKSDGDNIPETLKAKTAYSAALHLFPPPPSGWLPHVMCASSLLSTGIHEIYEMMKDYIEQTKQSGYFDKKREEQLQYSFYESFEQALQNEFNFSEGFKKAKSKLEKKVVEHKISPFQAATELCQLWKKSIQKLG